jgi:NDP-sugar pyrophosphorylase family protein
MICNQAGEPAGLTMLRCGCLRNINNVGFVDLNEQALPEIAECHEVRVVRYDRPVAHPLRTLNQYLSTLRTYHRRESGRLTDIDPYLEDWQASFEIIENGAAVHEDSVVHDSVILAGARIEAGATLVRCLVCPGSVVTKGKSVVDQVISSRVQHV